MSSKLCVAERVGFEPTVPFRTTVFETVRFGRSRTSPLQADEEVQLTLDDLKIQTKTCAWRRLSSAIRALSGLSKR